MKNSITGVSHYRLWEKLYRLSERFFSLLSVFLVEATDQDYDRPEKNDERTLGLWDPRVHPCNLIGARSAGLKRSYYFLYYACTKTITTQSAYIMKFFFHFILF